MSDKQQPTTIEITADTMLGDMVKLVIDELKAAPDVWQKLSEDRQQDVIYRVTSQCNDLIRQAVEIIAADGREVITADVEQITAKDEIKAVCKLAKHDPQRHSLLDAVGKPVLIVVAGHQQFLGGEIPQAEPDQPDLPVADNGLATAA